jgi:hypothetical protein
MTEPLFPKLPVREAFDALRKDLIHEDGPRISTMRNYRFAILQYDPVDEFAVREETQRLYSDLKAYGWEVLPLDLQKLLLARLDALGTEWTDKVVAMEKRMAQVETSRGLNYLKSKIAPLIEGPDGIAADCSREILAHLEKHPDKVDRMVALIGRAGALYPFFRSSALLRHLDGRTRNVPVVLLYPGQRRGPTALSFMGVLEPDSDYRPRIYP